MNEGRAKTQDIRPLRIAILNLMPDKITTETQILRKIGNTIVQIDITLLAIENHISKNTSQTHLDTFYRYFSDVKGEYFDGIIITGAPIEHLSFQDVSYWNELKEIFDWTKTNVFASLFICWGSQAAMKHFYGIEKSAFDKKLFGVFPHIKECENDPLFLGMDDVFYVPHSRNTESIPEEIRTNPNLEVLASSPQAGIHLAATKDRRQLFMTGHPEYDTDTLLKEYQRDIQNHSVEIPANYFIGDNPANGIDTRWKSHASLFYQNWINHYVYQVTEYELANIKPKNGTK